MDRVNVNLPSEDRGRLRRLARKLQTTEGELARAMLIRSLDAAELDELREALQQRSPERRERDRVIARALERLNG